jgi:hypothetical protein
MAQQGKRRAHRVEVCSAAREPRLPVHMRRRAVAAVHGEHPAARRLQLLAQRHLLAHQGAGCLV